MFRASKVKVGLAGLRLLGPEPGAQPPPDGPPGRGVRTRARKVLKEVRAAYGRPCHAAISTTSSWTAKVDAIAIAAPAAQHYVLAREGAPGGQGRLRREAAGARRVPEAEELVDLARKKKRVLMVGHILEYHPAIRKLKELVDAGSSGRSTTSTRTGSTWGRCGRRRTSSGASRPTTSPSSCCSWAQMPEWASTSGPALPAARDRGRDHDLPRLPGNARAPTSS